MLGKWWFPWLFGVLVLLYAVSATVMCVSAHHAAQAQGQQSVDSEKLAAGGAVAARPTDTVPVPDELKPAIETVRRAAPDAKPVATMVLRSEPMKVERSSTANAPPSAASDPLPKGDPERHSGSPAPSECLAPSECALRVGEAIEGELVASDLATDSGAHGIVGTFHVYRAGTTEEIASGPLKSNQSWFWIDRSVPGATVTTRPRFFGVGVGVIDAGAFDPRLAVSAIYVGKSRWEGKRLALQPWFHGAVSTSTVLVGNRWTRPFVVDGGLGLSWR